MSSSVPTAHRLYRWEGKNNENIPPRVVLEQPAASTKTSSPVVRGFLAFPPGRVVLNKLGGNEAGLASPRPEVSCESSPNAASFKKESEQCESDWEACNRRVEEARLRRLKAEGVIASTGEMDWVRSGGVLRDREGRRDQARTERIRQEIRLQMEEQMAMERWDVYESRWRTLFASNGLVTFNDLPWPLPDPPTNVQQLNRAAIPDFLFASLRVRTNTVTQKERIRASLLRWHPDKLASVLRRVVESDIHIVQEGISVVFMCLKALQDVEKTS